MTTVRPSVPWAWCMVAALVATVGTGFFGAVAGLIATWLALGIIATRIGVLRGLIAEWPESSAFYVNGAFIGPLALWAILREPWRGSP